MAKLELGAYRRLAGGSMGRLSLPPHHLLTHGVVVGMTGSGKTGLLFVLVEEALRSGVPREAGPPRSQREGGRTAAPREAKRSAPGESAPSSR